MIYGRRPKTETEMRHLVELAQVVERLAPRTLQDWCTTGQVTQAYKSRGRELSRYEMSYKTAGMVKQLTAAAELNLIDGDWDGKGWKWRGR